MEGKTDGYEGVWVGMPRQGAGHGRQSAAWGTSLKRVWLPVGAPVFWHSLPSPLSARLRVRAPGRMPKPLPLPGKWCGVR